MCLILLCLQTAAEYERRRENFFNELEVVFADVVIIHSSLPPFFSLVFLSDRRNDLKLTIRSYLKLLEGRDGCSLLDDPIR